MNNGVGLAAGLAGHPTGKATAPAGSNQPPGPVAPRDRGMLSVWMPSVSRPVAGRERSPLTSRVLAARGVVEADAAARFLEPSLTHLHDPSLLPGADLAAGRLLHAARAGEPIVIYGDYDVDGVSATAILFHTLKHVAPQARVATYVPHRLEEGYGLNTDAIRALAAEGARVIVSVDCGVTAIEPAREARRVGVDLIITDHHNPPASLDALPDAFAVVHPRRPDSIYPFGDLSGSAVAFKLAWRLMTAAYGVQKLPPPARALLLEMLGLASLGVIADVVPLRDENRVIARFGLSRIKHSPLVGLRALVEASGLGGESVEAADVGFKLGPRLNACGRLGHAREAVELLTVAGAERAGEIARMLTQLNNERRAVERRISEDAAQRAHAEGMTGPDCRAIVLWSRDWHQGVVGIACSRLVDQFHRPTILMQEHDAGCHGSGRSIDGFNLYDALRGCAEELEGFGGHDMAAGVRVRTDRARAFAERFVAVANDRLAPEDLVPTQRYDTLAEVDELSEAAVRELARLAPFGRDNPQVVLRLDGLKTAAAPKLMGADGKHAALMLRTDSRGADVRAFRAVGWSWGERLARVPTGTPVDVLISPKVNEWNGRRSVEGELIDLRIRGGA